MAFCRGGQFKPTQWGPRSVVASNIVRRSKNMGITPPSAVFAIWEGGDAPCNLMTGERGELFGTAPSWQSSCHGLELAWQASNSGYRYTTGIEGMSYGSDDKWSVMATYKSDPTKQYAQLMTIGSTIGSYWHGLGGGYYDNHGARFTADAFQHAYTGSLTANGSTSLAMAFGTNHSNSFREVWHSYEDTIVHATNSGAAVNRSLVNRLAIGLKLNGTSDPTGDKPTIGFLMFWKNYILRESDVKFFSKYPYFLIDYPDTKIFSLPVGTPPIFNLAALNASKPTRIIQ